MRRRSTLSGIAVAFAFAPPASAGGATIPVPDSDPFYAAPASLAAAAPGSVLRSRQVKVTGATSAASSTAYQLLYRSNDAKGAPIAAVTTLLLPTAPAAGSRKLVSYQTAEDSLTTKCAPSYTLQTGSGSTQNAESVEMATLLAQGWDVAVPDYQGPSSHWAVGPTNGRTTLDSIRAVEHFSRASLAGARTPAALMGYSGGSVPSIWANSFSARYAPELNLVGVAVGGLVPNPIANLTAVNGSVFAGGIVGLSVAVDRAYPELRLSSLLNARGEQLAAQDGRDAFGCAGAITAAPFGKVSDFTSYSSPAALASVPRVKDVFANLDLTRRPTPTAPSSFYNEIHDELAIIDPVDKLYAANCANGAVINYHRNAVGEHLTGAGAYAVPALAYLQDRFAGKPAPNTCPQGGKRFALKVRVPKRERVLRRRGVIAYARCSKACRMTVTARLRVSGHSYRLRTTRRNGSAGKLVRARAKLTRRAKRRLRSALKLHRRARVTVRLRAHTAVGDYSPLVSRRLRVRR